MSSWTAMPSESRFTRCCSRISVIPGAYFWRIISGGDCGATAGEGDQPVQLVSLMRGGSPACLPAVRANTWVRPYVSGIRDPALDEQRPKPDPDSGCGDRVEQ